MNDIENIVDGYSADLVGEYCADIVVEYCADLVVEYCADPVVEFILRHSVIDCFENLVVGYSANNVQTFLSGLFWQTIFLPPLMSPRQSSYVDPATQPAPRQYALLRYVLSNSLYNTYREMGGITGYGWDNDK